ncbi:MAG: glycogen debranching protein GlgX, partial [Rhodobacteraceae bacterium]|nr:glycogen debranching protein GlgX [Paracoccaceae bacterium]
VAKAVVPIPDIPTDPIDTPRRDPGEMLIYEAHVKGLTREHPLVEPELRGTYEGLVTDAMIAHYQRLGITAIELLPVYAFMDDAFLLRRGLRNYWGYNSIGFFTPEPRYFGPSGRAGFRDMVQRLHEVGIEVILDVVYNHTAETDHLGPTISFRGLDNASYYRLMPGQPRFYANDTGTGNMLDFSNPYVQRMVLDSLRYWVEVMGVDGFRFDLAATLGREKAGFDPGAGFLDALRQDPVLAGVRLIAEPWDIGPGGYQLGRFPPEFAEWNDQYRDAVRRFWRGDKHSAQELAARLLGSADHFDHDGRRAWSSVNFVTAHDGFTLADLTRYTSRHNLANGEDNRDGHQANFGSNFGVEGASSDPEIQRHRRRRQINLMATLLLSQGTPMMLAGDEIGNTQHGNNNAYCQDNALGWVNWDKADLGLLEVMRGLTALRQRFAVLRQTRFLHGRQRAQDGLPDVEWLSLDGGALDWRDPDLGEFALLLRGCADAPAGDMDSVLIVINGRDGDLGLTLPSLPKGQDWRCVFNSALDDPFAANALPASGAQCLGQSVMLCVQHRAAA